jgi:alpha-beta hydrolase superfamily lysophospholipase
LLLILSAPAQASIDADSIPLSLELRSATIGGTLLLPRPSRPYPCVVIVGGTLSHTRDGSMERPGAPPRTALKRLAETLAGAGYGSFRYDQVGHGESRAKAAYSDLYGGDAEVLAGIYQYLRGRSECTRIIAAGESAGAYVASLAAREGQHADGYLFLGGFCGKAEEIFSYNYGRFADYVARNRQNAEWAAQQKLDRYIAHGRQWPERFDAARAGKETFDVGNETAKLARRREELQYPPDEMYAFIRSPALALAGSRDLNVAPHHAACAVATMQRAGNLQTRSVLIDGADHNFQIAPHDADEAFRERYTFASFLRPYHPQLDREVLAWLDEFFPAHGHHHEGDQPNPGMTREQQSFYSRAVQHEESDPQTGISPPRVQLAPGLTIIDNILDREKTPGVETLEGRIGPLLRTPDMRAHFIDMPAGLYLEEHPHTKGSIIYTVRGTWGLKSLGRWHLMKPGSLNWFGDNIPTGFQVPFQEDAYILIFKATSGSDDATFISYLRTLAGNLKEEQKAGTAFQLIDLPRSHPALDFARKANPRFDQEFPSKTSAN